MRPLSRRVLRYLVAQNCFYLISGFLMLLGCLVMAQAPGADGLDLTPGLKLLGVMLTYQVVVVGLATHVRRRLRIENDGFNLAIVALVLLLDPTFFSTRFWGHSRAAGLAINGIVAVASIAMLAALIRAGFPIGRRAALQWIAALAAVYLGGVGLNPAAPGQGLAWFSLLSFVPLALVALAPGWQSSERAASESPSAGCPTEEIAVLWGDPRTIYRRYLTAVLIAYPFLVSLRHLTGLAEVFRVEMDTAHMAPALLGLSVLLARLRPRWIVEHSSILMGLAGASLWAGLCGRSAGLGGLAAAVFAPVLLLLAHMAFGLWMTMARDRGEFPLYAAGCSVLLAAGMDPHEALGALFGLEPAPLLVLAGWGAWWARRDRGFWEVWVAGTLALLAILRLTPLSSSVAMAATVHGAGVIYLVLVHLYPRKDLLDTVAQVAALVVAMPLVAAHLAAGHAPMLHALTWLELAALWVAGRHVRLGGYAPVALWLSAIDVGLHAWPMLTSDRGLELARTHGGPALVLLAFVCLLVGYRVTRDREAILRWIDEDEEEAKASGRGARG